MKTCSYCDQPADWWWNDPFLTRDQPIPLCDDHAADKDLDDLQELIAR